MGGAMKHSAGRKILRGMNRRERRQTIRGLWLIEHGGRSYSIRADGLPRQARWICFDESPPALTKELLMAAWDSIVG